MSKYPWNKSKNNEADPGSMEGVYAGPPGFEPMEEVYAGPPFDDEPMMCTYAGPEFFNGVPASGIGAFVPSAETQKFCTTCGNPVKKEHKFCPSCGAPIPKEDK